MDWLIVSDINRLILSDTEQAREKLIQLIDQNADGLSDIEKMIINELLDRVGLYPYFLEGNDSSFSASLRHAVHSIAYRPIAAQRGLDVLHSGQLEALKILHQGKNLLLFAPTSFGKTSLAFEFLAQKDFDIAVYIVPTLALMDEVRRNALKRLKCSVYTSIRNEVNDGLYVLTQERYITARVKLSPDLIVFDEFYKISDKAVVPERFRNKREHRSILLNRAWHKAKQTQAQVLALSPSVDHYDPAIQDGETVILNTDFETVNIIDIRVHEERLNDCIARVKQNEQYPILIYFKSPASLFETLSMLPAIEVSPFLFLYHQWLKETYFSELQILKALEKGYVAHYGPLSPSIRRHVVRLFGSDYGSDLLLCTATMVEGVNTAAKTVILFDKKVSTSNLSSLALRNIRGRAGRMGKHKIGYFVYYDDLSKIDESYLDIPIDSSTQKTAIEERIISDSSYSDESSGEYSKFMQKCIRKYPTLRFDDFETLYEAIDDEEFLTDLDIFWTGVPTNNQLYETFNFAHKKFLQGDRKNSLYHALKFYPTIWLIKAASEKSASRRSPGEVRASFFNTLDRLLANSINREDFNKFLFNAFRHSVPDTLRLMSELIPEIFEFVYGEKLAENGKKLDYTYFAEACSKVFTDVELFELEDIGMPLQISFDLLSRGVDLNLAFTDKSTFSAESSQWTFLNTVERWIIGDIGDALN